MSEHVDNPIHPSEILLEDWFLSQKTISAGALEVEHIMPKPSEAQADRLTHHFLVVSIAAETNRQITRIGKREYDGPNEDGAFFLSAADDKPSFWAWDGLDETICFTIDPQRLQQVANECGCAASGTVALKNVVYGKDPQLDWFAKQFRAEIQQPGVGERLYKDSLATLFALYLLRSYSQKPLALRQHDSHLGNRRLKSVLDYIEEHLEENIGLDQLAAIADLSKHHFSHMFKQSMGIPPYRYLLLQRIERTKQHLKQDDLSIGDIAAVCGFADQSHFTRHFTRATGTTPLKFRRGHSEC